jgi:hypothetical protein
MGYIVINSTNNGVKIEEFDDLIEASIYANKYGGWVVKTENKIIVEPSSIPRSN